MRLHRSGTLSAVVACALLVGGCVGEDTGGALDSDGTAPVRPGGATSVPAGGLPTAGSALAATLTGAEEAPGPGDPDGIGRATLSLTTDGQLCARVSVSGIDEPTAAHVHTGGTGLAGPVLFPLPTPVQTSAGVVGEACTGATKEQAAKLFADPSAFYVNVHTKAHPQGAVRGQLSKT